MSPPVNITIEEYEYYIKQAGELNDYQKRLLQYMKYGSLENLKGINK